MTKYRCNRCFAEPGKFCEYTIPDEFDGFVDGSDGDCPKWGSANWKKVEEDAE